jgi:hypothetical protein
MTEIALKMLVVFGMTLVYVLTFLTFTHSWVVGVVCSIPTILVTIVIVAVALEERHDRRIK